MQFLLNESTVLELNSSDFPPSFTLLDYLRIKQNLTGTKEGCASGDCGACTVLIGSRDNDRIEYMAVNSCITPLNSLQGTHIVSVEHLANSGKLHPAQHEMIACNGSQCGFCTPGFVMSLAGLYEHKLNSEEGNVSRHDVCDAISGNLCRCTGYKPIIEAGLAMQLHDHSSQPTLYTPQQLECLRSCDVDSDLEANSSQEGYHQPKSLDQLDCLIGQYPTAVLIAGGTDLMLQVTQNYQDFEVLIDVSRVQELRLLSNTGHSTLIGSSVSYTELEEWFESVSPQFKGLLERLGSRQIRNRGTIGGNIANASPIADTPPILLALGALLHLRNCDGIERIVPISEFYLSYKETVLAEGEYIRQIEIPLQNLSHFHRFYKISKRFEDDISSVMAAIAFDIKDGRFNQVTIAFGGVAATPVRIPQAEKVFLNQAIDDESILDGALEAIGTTIKPINDVRASAAYRMEMAKSLVCKAWNELNKQPVPELFQKDGHHDA